MMSWNTMICMQPDALYLSLSSRKDVTGSPHNLNCEQQALRDVVVNITWLWNITLLCWTYDIILQQSLSKSSAILCDHGFPTDVACWMLWRRSHVCGILWPSQMYTGFEAPKSWFHDCGDAAMATGSRTDHKPIFSQHCCNFECLLSKAWGKWGLFSKLYTRPAQHIKEKGPYW